MEPELRPARLADSRVHVLNALGISREAVLWDSAAPGLGLRTRPNGRKTWIVRRRCNGSVVRRTLGPLDALTIEDARVAALALLAEAVAGDRAALTAAKVRSFAGTFPADCAERRKPATRKTYAFQRAELVRRHRGHASRFGGLGAGGDVVVLGAVAARPAQPVLPLAEHGVRLSATVRW